MVETYPDAFGTCKKPGKAGKSAKPGEKGESAKPGRGEEGGKCAGFQGAPLAFSKGLGALPGLLEDFGDVV